MFSFINVFQSSKASIEGIIDAGNSNLLSTVAKLHA